VLPLYINVFSGWLDYPEYFFIWCYHGKNSIFNTMSYQSRDMDAFIDGAVNAAAIGDKATYEKDVKGFVDLAFADIPRIPIFSRTPTWRCRRTCPATSTGSTAASTTARW
jgi:peptide/nickel transport system substrate-binding protein